MGALVAQQRASFAHVYLARNREEEEKNQQENVLKNSIKKQDDEYVNKAN